MDVTLRRFPEILHRPVQLLQDFTKRLSNRMILKQSKCRDGKGNKDEEDGHALELRAIEETKLFIEKPGMNGWYTETNLVPRRRSR